MSVGRRLLFAFVVTLVGVGGAELSLAVLMPALGHATMPTEMVDAHLRGGTFRYDADLGWYWPTLPNPGAGIDAHGFRRTKAVAVQKPPGIKRVITFGDSQTYGAGMTVGATYSDVAEAELGAGWEVLNSGLSGYRSMNVLRLIKLRMAAFSPDAVVIDCMPFDSPRDDGTLLTARGSWQDPVRRFFWHSRTYYAMRLALQKLDSDRPRWLDRAPTGGEREANPGNHDLIWEWGRQNDVVVVFMKYAVMSGSANPVNCMTHDGELPPGAPVVPSCERLQADGRRTPELFLDQNHLTVAGNQVVGKALADTLRTTLP
jgi:hypothetical protein